MLRNQPLSFCCVVLLAGLAACVPATAPEETAELPNIILAMADDQGWGDMAYNGHPVVKTPVFDEMASAGLRFDRFYAAAPVCSPTRGSVMTGRTPNRFGCFKWGYTLRPEEVTVAEALKQAGYVTGHFGKWHLGSVRADSPVNPGNSGFERWFSAPNFFDNNPIMSDQGVAVQTEGESSMVTVEAALEFIREHAGGDHPFLAVVWFGSPHGPHEATPELRALYPDQTEEQQNFLGEITGMDRAMGRLRDEIRSLGIAENTLLWYNSDNGAIPQGSTGGLRGRKGTVWEGGLRVPAIIEWPARVPEPRATSMSCVTSDIYPTLLEIAGVTVGHQPPLDGVSLLPLIEGRSESRTKPIGFWDYPAPGRSTPSLKLMAELLEEQKAGQVAPAAEKTTFETVGTDRNYAEDKFPGHSAWLDGGYKLHRIEDESGQVKYELYNLSTDQQETTDIIAQETERAVRMKTELEAWLKSVVQSLNGADY